MKKIFIILYAIIMSIPLSAQENADSKRYSDEGWYFSNHFLGRWNHFGALYQGQLFYKKALFREMNNFFFNDSYILAGIEQELSSFSRTSAYVEFQPLIALKVLFKFTYEAGLADAGKPVLVDGSTKEFNHALPPFTGLNPMTKKPQYVGGNTIYFQMAPTITIGGPAGEGLIALIYTPYINYIRAFGIDKDDYIYLARESIVVKAEDMYFNHDIKLGYSMKEWGMSFAINTTIEQMLSSKDLYRVGLFAAYSYKKALNSVPSLSPFVSTKIGTWLIEKHVQYKFAIQLDAGIEWKFY
ncbi:hypothetical protein [Brachyspira hampsonii]|uniref:Uncharacterized protein n=2 Tax=Brachyspira hampsonii TaxID=1287055 RepID=A0A2U4FG09_9SPIR|nr:hypothetical protein [Brachyspira hampsonii]EKV56081.1 hypothetical protein A966_11991 [Brachyspira hampsonii 30446]MBW5390161.1 hypothetical protein [Brachyspira hampsonii]OEJ18076.1 hypothetical protein A9495_06625 [Brachyspira hampsonii]